MKIFVIYSVPNHCGHEVIHAIYTNRQTAIEDCHYQNVKWAKYMGYWDGTRTLFNIVTKHLPSKKEFDFDCDDCGYSDCDCFEKLEYKTDENYEKYWSDERKDHNQNHSLENPDSNCKFCDYDKTLWWIPALQSKEGIKA